MRLYLIVVWTFLAKWRFSWTTVLMT